MKRLIGGAILLALVGPLAAESKGKKPQEPFYRRFLMPGDPLDEKIKDQEKRVDANPKSADLRNDFGNLLAARRFPKEARQQYELATKLDPKHFLAPYNLGLLYETEGQLLRATAAYEKSVDRNRGFPLSRFRLGRLYEKRGWDQQAIEQYARALRIDPSMRNPGRNPLVADTRLLDRVSLENYSRDLATALLKSEAVYVDEARFRRVPIDRTLGSEDLTESAPAEPARGAPAAVAPAVVAPAAPVPARATSVAPASAAPGIPTPLPSAPRAAGPARPPTYLPGMPIYDTPTPKKR